MSHDAPIFRGQDESESAGGSDGEHARGSSDPRAVQLETIKALDDVLSDFAAQRTPMCDAFRLLATTLEENPSLTPEERAEAYDRYGGRLEESYGACTRAIARGSRDPNRASLEPDPLGEDGVGEPNVDDEARAPAQNPCHSVPSHVPRPPPKHGEQGGILKRTTDDEGNNRGDYAWNWDKPGGGPLWHDLDEGSLSVARKTHLLQNVYLTNIKRALQNLELQQDRPDFPPILWQDILANRQINLGALVEDQFSRVTTYNNVIDLGDNLELSTKRSGKSKTKVADGGQWHYAWMKYSMVVLWAYPHQQEELSTYCQLILGQFMAGVNIALNVEFDQAARKFFHGHQDLSFADVSQLAILSNQIFLPQEQRSGGAFNSSAAGPSQSTGRRRNKRKCTGSTSESPTCREFNKASGCKRLECAFTHKCSNCSSSSHSKSACTCKAREGFRK